MIANPMATQAGLPAGRPAASPTPSAKGGAGGSTDAAGHSCVAPWTVPQDRPRAGPGSQGGAPRIAAISLTRRTAYAPSRIIAQVRRAIRVLSRTAKCWSAKGRGRPFGIFGVVAMKVGSSRRLPVRISHKDQARIAP